MDLHNSKPAQPKSAPSQITLPSSKDLSPELVGSPMPVSTSPPSRPLSPLSFDNSRNTAAEDGPNRNTGSYATIPLPGSNNTRSSRRSDKNSTIASGRNKIFGLDANTLKNLTGKTEESFSDAGPHLTVETAACHDPTLIFGEPKSRMSQSDSAGTSSKPASLRSIKKKKKVSINPTSTPSDIFAATISDAMVGAEESENDEEFVRYNSNFPKRPNTTPFGQNFPHQPPLNVQDPGYTDHANTSGAVLSRPSKSLPPYHPAQRELRDGEFRPPKSSRKVTHGLADDTNGYSAPHRLASRNGTYGSAGRDGPYLAIPPTEYWDSEDERAPLFDKPRVSRRNPCWFTLTFTTGACMFLCGLFVIIFALSSQPLTDVEITQLNNVIATPNYLRFDVYVKGRNWNVIGVSVYDGNLDVFARAWNATETESLSLGTSPSDPEFLGSVVEFDQPLSFLASFSLQGRSTTASTQVRVPKPGQQDDSSDISGNERWSRIIRHTYEINVRGVLKYKLSPFSKIKLVRICGSVGVNPRTGNVMQIPDTDNVCDNGGEDDDGDGRGGPVDRF